jgi:hypothetical protein
MSQTNIEPDTGRITRPVRLVPEFVVRRIPRPRPDPDEQAPVIPNPALGVERA